MDTVRRYAMLIGGDWVDTEDRFEIRSPASAAYPFGGYKQSGLGRELGPHALDEYTEEKFVHLDLSGRLDRRAYPLLLGTPPA
jgi:acyl-CoA reductase-like NAD-dependent aldehyde dehydrogenase